MAEYTVDRNTAFCVIDAAFYNNEEYLATRPVGHKLYSIVLTYNKYDIILDKDVQQFVHFNDETELLNGLSEYPDNLIVISSNNTFILSYIIPELMRRKTFESIKTGRFSPKKGEGSYQYIGDENLSRMLIFKVKLNNHIISFTDFNTKIQLVSEKEFYFNEYSDERLFNGDNDEYIDEQLANRCQAMGDAAVSVDSMFPGVGAKTTIAAYTYEDMKSQSGFKVGNETFPQWAFEDRRRIIFNKYRRHQLLRGSFYCSNYEIVDKESVGKLDINNMYGNFLANYDFPTGEGTMYEIDEPVSQVFLSDTKFRFLKVQHLITSGVSKYFFTPIQGLDYKEFGIPDFLLNDLVKFNLVSGSFKIVGYIEFDKGKLPLGARELLKKNYEEKRKYKDTNAAISQAFKALNNTLYGKFIQRPIDSYTDIEMVKGLMKGVKYKKNIQLARSEYLPVGIGTVCYGGSFILNEIFNHHVEDRIVYIDTDCIVFKKENDEEIKEGNIGDKLGQGKIEAGLHHETLSVFGPKAYAIFDEDGRAEDITFAGMGSCEKIVDGIAYGYAIAYKNVAGGGKMVEKRPIEQYLNYNDYMED